MSQIFNVKMAKSHLLPYAYAVNPELVDPPKEMHGHESESESDEEPDEKMMAGEGAFHLHVHKHKIHLTPAHLKSLHAKKEVIFKKHMSSPYTKAKEHHFMVTKKMHRRIMRAHKHDKGIRIGAHHGEYGGLLMDETCRVPQIPATPYDKDQIPPVPSGDAMSSAAYKEATKYAVMKGGAKLPKVAVMVPGYRDQAHAMATAGDTMPFHVELDDGTYEKAGQLAGGGKKKIHLAKHAKLYGSSGSLRPILPAPSHMVQLGSPYAQIDSPAMSPFIPARNQNNGYNPI